MKKITLLSILVFIASTLIIIACKKEEPQPTTTPPAPVTVNLCDDVDCGGFGICDEGVCDCPNPYDLDENGKCNVFAREKFVGTYDTDEVCTNSSSSHTVQIGFYQYEPEKDIIRITNLWGGQETVIGRVVKDSVYIDNQQATYGMDYYIEATGKYTNGVLVINARLGYEDPEPQYTNCTFTCTKQ